MVARFFAWLDSLIDKVLYAMNNPKEEKKDEH